MITFPQDFFWGAGTSAYQVEGNNIHSDWWAWEKKKALKETSGLACRHYDFYKEDFALAKALNQNAHRLSIEWGRIEPEEGRFSEKEIGHYRDVILSLREQNLEPVITLNHFTIPIWFANLGGCLNRSADRYFLRYAQKIVDSLCDKVRFWVTINEPMVYTYYSYVLGEWPPQERSQLKAKYATDNLLVNHIKAYQLIHGIYKKSNLAPPLVSVAQNMLAFELCQPTWKNKLAAYLRNKTFNFDFIAKAARRNCLDFIGLNYYTRNLVDVESWKIMSLFSDVCKKNHKPLKKNSMGWDIYPEGLYDLLLKLKRFNLPVFIMENGICTDDDSLRWEYIYEHLKNIALAIDEGAKVIGYLYWSLLDNYEWDKGFSPRFGLIEVDYNTYKRTVRPSAWKFAEVCKTNILNK